MPDQTTLAESIKAEILAKPRKKRHWSICLSHKGISRDGSRDHWKSNETFGVLAYTIQQAIEMASANIVEAGGAELTVFAANDRGIIDLECETEENESVSEEKP